MDLRERALSALGKETLSADGLGQFEPPDAELIGLLLLELDRLTNRSNVFYGPRWFSESRKYDINILGMRLFSADTRLEALVLAVEAAREGK